jgi:hypothetical protein
MQTLDKKQLIALVRSPRKKAVIGWLDQQRIPYLVGADGWPRVSAAVISARLGETVQSKPEPRLRFA